MLPRTIATLDRLEKASWFSRVGIIEGPSAAVVTSWPEAIAHCDTSEWEDLRLEALNQYRECIAHRSKERLELWNDAVREVKKTTRPLVARKIATVVREHALPEIFTIRVNHDIPGFCMEAEYADVCPPASLRALATGTSMGIFPAAGGARFPRDSL
jgi:hypothetical protein